MNIVKLDEVIKTYQRIDLYRAKYRHNDFTPYAWCFHGNKAQSWVATCSDGFLRFTHETALMSTSIAAATYKYVSFRFSTPALTTDSLPVQGYKVQFVYSNGSTTYAKEILAPYSASQQTIFFDMSAVATWTGTITAMGFHVSALINTSTWSDKVSVSCEYIKVDKDNVFAGIGLNDTISIVDFNEMRDDIELFYKNTIAWLNPGTGDNRVREFVDTVHVSDLEQVNQIISALAPYNGCATCDSFQCSCNETSYGYQACQTCNGCNQYLPCNACNGTCFQQALTCSCNGRCYVEPIACSCNGTCYGYSACRCNGSCDSYSDLCSSCHGSAYNSSTSCSPCYSSCDGYSCNIQHGGTVSVTDCTWCNESSDAGCGSDTDPRWGCPCNSSCNSHSHHDTTCVGTCYSGYSSGCNPNASSSTTSCTICNGCNSESSSGCSSYGSSGCTSCNNTCYVQPRVCTCNGSCNGQARSCVCDSRCYEYQACLSCDSCNGYLPCTCNATCFTEGCSQCHKTSYSSVPI